MLSRLVTRSVRSVERAGVAPRALHTAAGQRAPLPQWARHQQKQQQQPRQITHSLNLKWLGAVAAVIAGGVTVVACEQVVEQKTGGGVDYGAVRKALEDMMDKEDFDDGSYGPILVRLAWHSAGTYNRKERKWGSDGATMRFSPESNHGANAGLGIARDVLEPIKKKFPGCSYADLYTLAGCVAIESMGGPHVEWRSGRSDAPDESSCPPDGQLPDASQGAAHLRAVFTTRMGFNDREIVALSGAHALGRCHTDRSGYKGPWTRAPTTFSNEYFKLLLDEVWTEKKWNGPRQFENSQSGSDLMMLPTDLVLIEDPVFKRYVEQYAADEKLFFRDFAKAFQRLLELGVNFDKKTQTNLQK